MRAARRLLEERGAAMPMRQLAVELRVDVMAIYHYFPSKAALVDAVMAESFRRLDNVEHRLGAGKPLADGLLRLGVAYLKCVTPVPHLTRCIARGAHGDAGVVARFDRLFGAATGLHPAHDRHAAIARDVFVDYLHGYALSGRTPDVEELRAGVRLIAAGIERTAGRPDERAARASARRRPSVP